MPTHYQTGLQLAFAIAAVFLLLGAVLAVVASMQPASRGKVQTRLFATIFFGSSFCVLGVIPLWLDWIEPLTPTEGIIHNVHIRGGKDHQTVFQLTTPDGTELQLTADGTSPNFRSGQLVRLTFETKTHFVRKATFLSPTGEKQGTFNAAPLWPWLSFALGLFLLAIAFQKASRDLAKFGISI